MAINTKKPYIVRSLAHLITILSDDDQHKFYIQLNLGAISRKEISMTGNGRKKFHISNNIDGSTQTLTETQIMSKKHTNIGEAIRKLAFWCEDCK